MLARKFNELNICPELLTGIEKLGFKTPTPVQQEVIPFLLEKNDDLVALAQTGTGKTGAFGLPILQRINRNKFEPQALILCPTRDLCIQITGDLKRFSSAMPDVKTLAVYGGTDIRQQLSELQNGVHIIVATPGRMVDILQRKKADFKTIKHVVLDEADEMLNMGFEEDLQTILSDVPDNAQTLLFSATMPDDVVRIAKNYMNTPHEITIGSKNRATDLVKHQLMVVHAKNRYDAVRRIVDASPDIYGIIFCRTRSETTMVAERLSKEGYAAEAINGDLLQDERDVVMNKFRNHHLDLLVATDVAARGLDINDLTHVIHFSIPDDVITYTHRSGRTGRAGKTGTSIAVIHMREHFKIERIEKALGKKFEQKAIPTGKEIGTIRLNEFAKNIYNFKANDELLTDNLEQMISTLEGLSKEELIKRVALMQHDKLLRFYRDTPDLSTEPEKQRTKPNPETRKSGKEMRDAHTPRKMTEGMIEMVVNVGKRNELTSRQLKEILNDTVGGRQMATGRINIVEMQTYFEVPYSESTDLLKHFADNKKQVAGRTLNVALAGNARKAEGKKFRN
jgi:ATP-dependent RNA helicase DeaD